MATPSSQTGKDFIRKLREETKPRRYGIAYAVYSDPIEDYQDWSTTDIVQGAPGWYVDHRLDDILADHGDDGLDTVLSHLVRRGLWGCVAKVLQRGIRSAQRQWVIEEALKEDASLILPHCKNEELEQLLTPLVTRGRWRDVDDVLRRGVGSTQHSWAVQEALKYADEHCFTRCMLHHCAHGDLEQVVARMASRGLWTPVDTTHDDVSITQHILSQLSSRGGWEAVGRFLQRNISSSQHRWAVEQASRQAEDVAFCLYVLPQCDREELDIVMKTLVSRGMWLSVNNALMPGSTPQHRWVVEQAIKLADDSELYRYVVGQCSDDEAVAVFPLIVANKRWPCARRVLYRAVFDSLSTWITSEHDGRAHDTLFWKLMHHCRVELSLALELTKAMTQEVSRLHCECNADEDCGSCIQCEKCSLGLRLLSDRVSWESLLCESLMTSLAHTLCYVMCSEDRDCTDSTERTKQCVSEIYANITSCIKDNAVCIQRYVPVETINNKTKWTSVFTEIADTHKTDPLFLLHFLQGLNLYHVSRRGKNDDDILLVMLAVFPLFPQLQSVALRVMLCDKRWDVISQACLSHAWEHDRRRLFRAVVEHRKWEVVWQWLDHTVHDDQRDWAMDEAFREKEWDVYLLLADHGLTMPEQMHAHYMVAKYGDWETVREMVERGGDITEVSNLLENWVTGNLRKKPQGDATVYMERCEKLIRMRLRFAKNAVLSPTKALQRCKWGSVLFNILHEPTSDYFTRVLDTVIEERQWHILMHLVRLGMNKAERDWLFPEMVRQQQWGVCRMLLEYGVREQLCVDALPELMERNQWMLVARVMEYEVDDAVRRQVMQWAFHWRAGVLFWHCLNTMKYKQHLCIARQFKLFHQALSREIWQAVKPLMVEKGGPRMQHRDMAFLEAIEQHLWDVVDHCELRQGADMNMKDENGETPLNREARKEEWKAVEQIVVRDGKPNLLDKDGISVLNRLICRRQWDIVKTVIMYGGDIHLPAKCPNSWDTVLTPLQALIDARQADIIKLSIMWCGDQKKGLNDRGETCFHAVCDSDMRWDVMEDLVVRKVDPLAVTRTGHSPLVYAVLNRKCPQRMVAECNRLGFSSHQPSVTGPQHSLLDDIIHTVVDSGCMVGSGCRRGSYGLYETQPSSKHWCFEGVSQGTITSPLVYAVLRDLPAVVRMLYESKSCSYTEMVTLHALLPKLIDLNTEEGTQLYKEALKALNSKYVLNQEPFLQRVTSLILMVEKFTPFLRQLYTTPRTLQTSCRLLILQHFHFSDTKRHLWLDELLLSVPLKNYLEFSDHCDPDFGSDLL